jgi:hypothetical protein
MLRTLSILVLAAAIALGVSACSSSGQQTLDPNARLYGLTPSEYGTLCDWEAVLFGGWDADTVQCGDGGTATASLGYDNQAACVQNLENLAATRQACTETVGVAQTCFQWAVHSICPDASVTLPAECSVTNTTACTAQ